MSISVKYLTMALLIACATPFAWSIAQPPFIEALLQGDDAIVVSGISDSKSPVVTLGRRFGGSVVSIYYRGVEYVNNDSKGEVDRGRQLQSAVQYRGANECFNPTEAGGKYDRGKPMSSSRLLSVERPQTNAVVTQTDMAFWMAPGQKVSNNLENCTAFNTDYRAGYLLKRTLQVGAQGFPNVIYYKTQFVAPVAESNPRYVPLVIHTTARFKRVFRLNVDGNIEEVVGKRNERGSLPFMISTDDQMHAVVVCSATPTGDNAFYGYTRFPNITTSRFVYFGKSVEKESRAFDNYVIVGSASEVRDATRKFCFVR